MICRDRGFGFLLSLVFCCFCGALPLHAEEAKINIEEINKKFGLPILQENLWEKGSATDYAETLGIPLLDKSSYGEIFQRYTDGVTLLDRKMYYMALYARENKPTYLYLVFGNVGDIPADESSAIRKSGNVRSTLVDDYKALGKELTALFGKPLKGTLGNSHFISEETSCWQAGDTVFVLSCPRQKATILRVMPLEQAKKLEDFTIAEKVTSKILKKRVAKNKLGDITLDMMMVDQGGKGYCVPATIERYLRYFGINAEMYSLAVTMKSGWGGGTSVKYIEDVFAGYTRKLSWLKVKGMRVSTNMASLQKTIGSGQPIFSFIYSNETFNDLANKQTKMRQGFTSKKNWKKELDKFLTNRWAGSKDGAHIVMIVGVNPYTDEIGFSDSWGAGYKVRWLGLRQFKEAMQDSSKVPAITAK